MRSSTVPTATYRLQLNASFPFDSAIAIVDYLAALGISHCYTSNYLTAVPGSTHGYDVADPTQLNPEIGDEATYLRWVAALRERGMGHLMDLVPNHMGIAKSANPWWQDVLENGESSRYADVFDIDWRPLKPELEHKVLLPVLGDVYGAVLERQEIRLEYTGGAFQVRYFEQVFPIAPGTYDRVLSTGADALLDDIGADTEEGSEFLSILTAIRHLPGRNVVDPQLKAERYREKEVIKRRLAALTRRSRPVLEHVQRAITAMNGTAGQPRTFDRLDELLSAQPYRLSYWRVAAEEINYRRFFDINELAAIRMEDPSVFARAHAYAFDLLARGAIDGFRIDHVDGLYDPADYLQRLQTRARELRPDMFTGERPLYVVVEKILAAGEALPDWPVAGTTGYDFLVALNGLFVDERNERAVNSAYEQFTRLRVPYREIAYRGKQLILRVSMASELNVLAHRLNRFSERSRHYRDFTLNSLNQAMREIIACFPVYRTYVNRRDRSVSARDRAYINSAVREAKRRNPNRPAAVYDFIRDLLLKRADFIPDPGDHMDLVAKFQQLTSPVTAKGIEDTALYIYNRLASMNEVGGEPDHFGMAPADLHTLMTERARRWPHGLSATSTHDTKRSEDVRARLNVLSELPGAWKPAAQRWARINRHARSMVNGQSYPSRNEEYLFYQTLVGSWPLTPMDTPALAEYQRRVATYMLKAMRESKVFTSWINPSEPHEQAMTRFVESVLSPDNTAFLDDFLEFQRRVAHYGIYNSLAQLTVKIGAPGVPDFYQGTELWDLSLVDPDNRRPVDYDRRQKLLTELECAVARRGPAAVAAELMASPTDDRLKLFTTMMMLRLRREHHELFADGGYEAVAVEGARREHVFAFARVHGPRHVIVAVPRLVASLVPDADVSPTGERVWGDTRLILPPIAAGSLRGYHHALTRQYIEIDRRDGGASVRAAQVFETMPVAVLEAS